jgi:hypothetical protein
MTKRCRISSPRPTSINPKTMPPLKATLNALSRLVYAFLAVLTLALTAICIAM